MMLQNKPTFTNQQELKSFIDMVIRKEFNNNQIDNKILTNLISHKNFILEDFNSNNSVSDITFFSHLFLPIASYKDLFDRKNKQRLKTLNDCIPILNLNIDKIYNDILALLLMSKYGWCINSDSMIHIYQHVYIEIIYLLGHNSAQFTIADNAEFLNEFDSDITRTLDHLNKRLFNCCQALKLQEHSS